MFEIARVQVAQPRTERGGQLGEQRQLGRALDRHVPRAARAAPEAALRQPLAGLVAVGPHVERRESAAREERVGRAVVGDAALVEQQHVAHERADLVEPVRAEHQGRRLRQRLEELEEALARARVETAGRLVEDQQRRVGRQRERDQQLLLHAARERAERTRARATRDRDRSARDRALDARAADRARARSRASISPTGAAELRRDLRHVGHAPRDRDALARTDSGRRCAPRPRSASRPIRTRFSVDLPEPFGPTSATRRPGSTSNETPPSACTGPKRLRASRTSIRTRVAPAVAHARLRVDQHEPRLEQRHDAPDRLDERRAPACRGRRRAAGRAATRSAERLRSS